MTPISQATHCMAIPGQHIIDMICPETGKSYCFGNTPEEIAARAPGAVLMTWTDWQQQEILRQQTPITWIETTEADYWDMLEVLPPAYQGRGGFLVGEPFDHCAATGRPRFSGYRQLGDRYFVASRAMTISEFKTAPFTLEN
jgi:hypothetical protein